MGEGGAPGGAGLFSRGSPIFVPTGGRPSPKNPVGGIAVWTVSFPTTAAMSVALKPLVRQTLVITGASSGIGRATALAAAREGARLVLAARSQADLDAAADECRALGAEVETVAVDVADDGAADRLHDAAHARFGGVDTWVNNAGVSVYGWLRDVPLDDARRVFETNYWGLVHGSLAAARHFRELHVSADDDAYGGAIINVGSVLSDRAIPLQGHYSASKHAVKGFTDALRMELEKEGLPVSVTLIKPNATNTPYPERAANHLDTAPALPAPTYAPEVVAEAILHAATHPTREVMVGAKDGATALLGAIAPRLTDKLMNAAFFEQQRDEAAPPDAQAGGTRAGTLHAPVDGAGRVHGDAEGPVFQRSLWAQVQRQPLAALGLAVAAGAALVAMGRE